MLVDPDNRLVADTLEGEWNEKLRILAKAREDRERAREHDQFILDEAVRERLVAMTVDFNKLWADPDTPNRERKRLLAHIIEDVTLVKLPAEGTTKVHVRFKGGKIQTLTTLSPKSSAQQVKTQPGIVELVDKLLDDHIYSEIAELLNQKGYRPGEAARRGRHNARFTALRVAYLVHQYKLRSRYDRLRERGMLTKQEAAARLNIHEHTVTRWAKHGLITSHAYNGHYCLYELPVSDLPQKQCSRWNRLVDRAAARRQNASQAKTLN
ncbi:helix-turn-helix domain-containing protein (plasmid) [Mesorhizobium mediterraneum]|uniref:helix-turn-helix domain-containing protein n=1 Tax=Mesorhizobium TaxID=68287 RepID=UPI001FDABEE1|nr:MULTISPECIES: helix-turn-helix domain-containing protein [Mesorhizobium]WIW57262.1 helix-turn-helix domain-containing protein [Mesorhizobium mediterraneum]